MRKTLFVAATAAVLFTINSTQAATITLTPADVQANRAAIQQAMNQLQPGDTLYLAGGEYTPTGGVPNDNTLDIRPWDGRGRSGRADAWITVRNKPGEKPVLNLGSGGKGGMAIVDASYWRIEGLELKATTDSRAYGGGLTTTSTGNGTAHHLQFVNNIVHGFGESGIGVHDVSQVLIEGNTVYDNCHRSSNGTSGINLAGLKMKTTDNSNFAGPLGNPGNAYAMIVRNNRVYYNRNLYPDSDHGSTNLTDGNGIIVDYCDETGFTGKTLIVNNLLYHNGGAGVHIFKSSNVDVFHNIAYQNAWLTNGTQLSNAGPRIEDNVTRINRWFNNIAVGGHPNIQNGTYINGGRTGGGNYGWQDPPGYFVQAQWDKNVFFNTDGNRLPNGSTGFPTSSIIGDPKFMNAVRDTTGAPTADFHLLAGSPAINQGVASSTTNITTDHDSRTRDSSPDIGAYEAVSSPTPTPTPLPTPTPTPSPTGSYKVRFYPHRSYPSRMVGGVFQGSNTNITSGYENLATITTTPSTENWTELNLGSTTYRYLRYVSPTNGYGNIAELQFYKGATKLTGTGFGTTGTYSNTGFNKALDNNTYTNFESAHTGAYVGIDTGSATSALVDRTLEAGGAITAHGDYAAGGEGKEKAFDNNTSNKWLDFSGASWIQYGFANNTSRVITRYVITSGNDEPNRDPKNWVLQGSNDGSSFVNLDTRSNESFSSRNLSKTYDFSNNTAYKFYRLNITANYGGVGITQLSELRLWGP